MVPEFRSSRSSSGVPPKTPDFCRSSAPDEGWSFQECGVPPGVPAGEPNIVSQECTATIHHTKLTQKEGHHAYMLSFSRVSKRYATAHFFHQEEPSNIEYLNACRPVCHVFHRVDATGAFVLNGAGFKLRNLVFRLSEDAQEENCLDHFRKVFLPAYNSQPTTKTANIPVLTDPPYYLVRHWNKVVHIDDLSYLAKIEWLKEGESLAEFF